MNHVIVGPVVAASAERLVLGDGTEFAVSGLPSPPTLATGMTVKVVYRLAEGMRTAESITVLRDR